MRENAGFGIDIGFNVRIFIHCRRGFDEQKFALRTGLEIDTLGFVILGMWTVCCGETFAKKDDKGIAGFAEGSADLFLSFRDTRAYKDHTSL